MIKSNDGLLKKIILFFYFFLTTVFFIFFYKTAPKLTGDAYLYNELSDKLLKANLNIFTFNFGFRTFLYPLFLSLCKIVADVIRKNPLHVIFLFQVIVFHLGNFVLFKAIKKYSDPAALFFIIFSAINVINLSFVSLLLTENLSYLFIALIFYYFVKTKKNIFDYILLALFSALSIFLRPAFLLMYILILFFISYRLLFKEKSILKLIIFITLSVLVLSVGFINNFMNTRTIGVFNPKSSGEYVEQIYHGSFLMKYETTIDPNEKSQIMQYIYKGRYYLLNDKCKDEILTCIGIYKSPQCPQNLVSCQIQSFQSKPVDFISLTLLHLFNFFDRTYVDTYVNKIADRNLLLQIGDYIVLSSSILIFFIKKSKKFLPIISSIAFFSVINTVLYLPTKVEPRFSSPIFPLLLILTSIYVIEIIKNKQYRYLLLNGIFTILFFMISELINLTLLVGDIPVHLVK